MRTGNQHSLDVTGLPSIFSRVLPSILAVAPISMLFGVLAAQSDWSIWETFLISFLGFSGSAQFAVLPLSSSEAGLFTMIVVTASINSRYFPIALVASNKLPRRFIPRAILAHCLGDEAYATESRSDSTRQIAMIRFSIFVVWVLSALLGYWLVSLFPNSALSTDLNLGYPASAVLLFLSIAQLKDKYQEKTVQLRQMLVGFLISGSMYGLIGPTYFWVPSIVLICVYLVVDGYD